MTKPIFRIHPSIGLARVGNSKEYYLAPESIAALPQRGQTNGHTLGGLPLQPGTKDSVIQSKDLRDHDGAMKRQAARFRIFQYPESAVGQYPAPEAKEIVIESKVGKLQVVDILWGVHIANKKAAAFISDDDHGVHAYEEDQTPVLRNLTEGLDPHNALRLRKLVIDPGPRAIRGSTKGDSPVSFDTTTAASYLDGAEITPIQDYPASFPGQHFKDLEVHPATEAIDTLGELRTDTDGRLIVTGGHGRTAGWHLAPPEKGKQFEDVPIEGPVNNDRWFDDTADGPVSATILFDDGSAAEVHGGWVVITDPSYAPQTLNVVSLWDEAYDTFVRQLDLDPRICKGGTFNADFEPFFDDHIQPFFKAAAQQLWNTYLPEIAIEAHRAVGAITAQDPPQETIMAGLAFIRQPDPGLKHTWKSQPSDVGAPLMPLSLGDTSKSGGKSFLSPSVLQYFLLERWAAGKYRKTAGNSQDQALGDGEYLDRAALQNCLGGRFSPGIDIGFIVREPEMYEDWTQGAGPFRIKHQPLDYTRIVNRPNGPFLSLGWLPRHPEVMHLGLQPGDVTKFLALPWQADYNSCAIHQTSPNNLNSNSLYWSWPGQRPVTAYVAKDYDPNDGGHLPAQRYWS